MSERTGIGSRGMLAGLAILALLAVLLVYDQTRRNDANFRAAAAEDLTVIAALIAENLQRGAYAAAGHTVDQWAARNTDVVAADVTAKNGYVIAHFERAGAHERSLKLTTTVAYSYDGEARITLTKELRELDAARYRIMAEVFGIYAVIVVFVLLLMRALRLYRQEAQRLRHEIENRRALEQERIEAARINLQLASVVRHAQEFIATASLDGRVDFVNEFGRQLYGLGPDEVVGERTIPDFVHPSHHERLRLEVLPALARTGHWSGRLDFRRQSGDAVPMLTEGFRIDDADGRPLKFASVSRDISELVRADLQLQRLNRIHLTLSHTNQAIVRATSEAELVERACQIAVDCGGFALVWIGFLQPDGSLPPQAVAGPARGYLEGIRVMSDGLALEGRGPSGEALRSGAHVVVNDFLSSERMRPWWDRAQRFGIGSSAAFPLSTAGRVVGTLNVYSAESDHFGDREISLLDDMAGDISFGLESLRRSVALDRSVEQLRDVEATVRVGALRVALPAWSLWWSQGTPALLNLPAGAVAERASLHTALGPELASILEAALEQAAQTGNPVDIDLPLRVRPEAATWIRLYGVPRRRSDGATEVSCTLQDISDRKLLELAVTRAADAERRRLASELHDNLGQILFGLSMLLESIVRQARAVESPLTDRVEHTTEVLQEAMRVCRTLAHGASPVLEGGLSAALRELADGISASGIECVASTSETADSLVTGSRALELYRIAQEAVTNAVKHGRCRRIEIELALNGPSLELSIRDDGAGAEPSVVGRGGGIGLQTMRYRAARAGGTLDFRSRLSQGTIVRVRVPLLAEESRRPAAGAGP